MSLSQDTIDILAGALLIAPAEVTPDLSLGGHAAWDSLAHMRLIFAIEKHLEQPLGPEAILSITTAQEVQALIDQGAG